MEQYMSNTRADYGSGVARPKIEDKDNFELKGPFLKELLTNTFSGSDHEDANEHFEKVYESGENRGGPAGCRRGGARAGLYGEPLAEKRYQLDTTLQQKMQEVILFYNGLGILTRQILDSRGAIPSKIAADAQSIEDTLSKFMSESSKRHEENSNLTKEIRASTDAAIRNQGASIKTLEIQIGICLQDIKDALILGRPFLSTARAKIDVYKRKITLRIGKERIIFKSVRGSLDLLNEDYIELNDLNEPFKLKRNQVLVDIDAYRDEGMGDVIFGEPFLREVGIKARRFKGMITIYNGNDSVTYQIVLSHPRFKHHTNDQYNKIPPLLKDPITFEMRRRKNGSHAGTLACMRWNGEEMLKKSLT
ncbi:hypothetical protein Tco_0496571 [Tanacetum coccineum]